MSNSLSVTMAIGGKQKNQDCWFGAWSLPSRYTWVSWLGGSI